MSHDFLYVAKFWWLLTRLDQYLAEQCRRAGCPEPDCGGKLHWASYERKPRGVLWTLLMFGGQRVIRRLSLCCSKAGCRRRVRPPSVRFLGRRVYVGAVVVVLNALAHGLQGPALGKLCQKFGVSALTFNRWRRWWQEELTATAWWKGQRGDFQPSLQEAALPWSLLERFKGKTLLARLVHLLQWITPLSAAAVKVV